MGSSVEHTLAVGLNGIGTYFLLAVLISPTLLAAQCLDDTGGTCKVFSCSASRGPTNCVQGVCICKPGYCLAQRGVCTRSSPAPHPSPSPGPSPRPWPRPSPSPHPSPCCKICVN